MRKMHRQEQERVRQILMQYTPPKPETFSKNLLMEQLNRDVWDMDYLNPQSFLEKLLTQLSYLSPWIWLIQIGLLAILFCFVYYDERERIFSYMMFPAPCLILILLWEMSKTFGHNMWEMESACRYNLPQLFFFRLCILSGTDFLVLGGALTAFRMTGGLLWQFALCVLLPFFLAASLCLWTLQYFGNRINRTGLAAVCLMLFVLWMPLFSDPILNTFINDVPGSTDSAGYPVWLPEAVLWATLTALVLFLICAFRLCTRQCYENHKFS